jgi:putative transcriptional regulator
MAITHHPDDATLMSFASGALPEAHAAVVSTHLVACPDCRNAVREMELIGSALFNDLPESTPSVSRPDIARVLGCDSELDFDLEAVSEPQDAIVRLTGHRLDDIPWKRLGWGVWHYPIKMPSARAGDLRLLKVQSGQAMPEHGHGGNELTLILDGSYTDEFGTFAAGDIADLDDSVEHRPIADGTTGCICLVSSDSKVKLKGVIGRLVQPFAGI